MKVVATKEREGNKMTMTTNECTLYDQMVRWGIATADEINLVRNLLDGSWENILQKICYARTGYQDLNDFLQNEIFSEEEDEEDESETED